MLGKGILSKLFSRHASESEPVTEASPVSPYAKLREETEAKPAHPSARVRVKDVFLLDQLTPRPVDTVALFYPDQATWLVRDPYTGELGRLLKLHRETPIHLLYGDWTGSGRRLAGFYDPGQACFALWSRDDSDGDPDNIFLYGVPGSDRVPLVGDWDGDGRDGIGLYAPDWSCFLLRNEASFGEPDITTSIGRPGGGYQPLAGDWTGRGRSGIGLFDPSNGEFSLYNDPAVAGEPDFRFRLGHTPPGVVALAGDWNGDGAAGIACYDQDSNQFLISNLPLAEGAEQVFHFGARGVPGIPLTLRWTTPH